MNRDVFISYTPYHTITQSYIANSEKYNKLFIIGSCFDQNLIRAAKQTDTFDEIHNFGERSSEHSGILNHIYKRFDCFKIHQRIEFDEIDRVVTGHDKRAESQYIMAEASKNGVRCEYSEDGAALYNTVGNQRSKRMVTFRRLLFGKCIENNMYHGKHSCIETIYASYPDLIQKSLQDSNVPISPIPYENDPPNFIDGYISQIDQTSQCDIDTIILMPLIEATPNSTLEFIQKYVQGKDTSNNTVAIKYHPRESNRNMFFNEHVVQIDNKVPAELIFIHPEIELETIIGTFSTALITARIFEPEAEVRSIGNFDRTRDALSNVFKNLDIYTDGKEN